MTHSIGQTQKDLISRSGISNFGRTSEFGIADFFYSSFVFKNLSEKKSIFEFSVTGQIKISLKEFVKQLLELTNTKVVFESHDYDAKNLTLTSEELNVYICLSSSEERNSINFYVNDHEIFLNIKAFLASALQVKRDNENIYAISRTPKGGLDLMSLGKLEYEFEKENYESETIAAYDHVLSEYSSPDPKGRLVILNGKPGVGKAQPLDSIIYTPRGPRLMKDMQIGDEVLTPENKIAKIIDIYPQGKKAIYRVFFDDNTYAECCKEHLWKIYGKGWSSSKVLKLEDVFEDTRRSDGGKKLSIQTTKPVEFKEIDVLIDPYLMGFLLGDGSFRVKTLRFSTQDLEIVEKIKLLLKKEYNLVKLNKELDYNISKKNKNSKIKNFYAEAIAKYGLMNLKSENKFIPKDYLFTSIKNRIELLKGLMDSDGWLAKPSGMPMYGSTSEKLSKDFATLVQSLGGVCYTTKKIKYFTYKGEKKQGKLFYESFVKLPNNIGVFSLNRKTSILKKRTKYFPKRMIDKIEYIGEKEAQCISLDSQDGLYLTDNFIVTHNSHLVRGIISSMKNSIVIILPSRLTGEIDGPELMQLILSERKDRYGMFNSNVAGDVIPSLSKKKKRQSPFLFLIEDADSCLVPRGTDNMSTISSLLNYTDGIFGAMMDIRIIATTNAESIDFDAALTRPGRLCSHIYLELLKPAKASEVYKRIAKGKEKIYTVDTSLAQVYQDVHGVNNKNDKTKKQVVGFGS